MSAGGGREPREHLSCLTKDAMRNGYSRRERNQGSISHHLLTDMQLESDIGGERGAKRDPTSV